MQIDDPFLPAKPFALNIPLEVWLVVSLFCDANFAYKPLRAVCRWFKRAVFSNTDFDPERLDPRQSLLKFACMPPGIFKIFVSVFVQFVHESLRPSPAYVVHRPVHQN